MVSLPGPCACLSILSIGWPPRGASIDVACTPFCCTSHLNSAERDCVNELASGEFTAWLQTKGVIQEHERGAKFSRRKGSKNTGGKRKNRGRPALHGIAACHPAILAIWALRHAWPPADDCSRGSRRLGMCEQPSNRSGKANITGKHCQLLLIRRTSRSANDSCKQLQNAQFMPT